MWQDSLRISAINASHEANEVPQILVNGFSFAERCQRLGKAIEWIKHEMSLMRENDEQLTKDFHEMEALTMELLPVLSKDRNRRNTLPPSSDRTSSQTSIGAVTNGYHAGTDSDESPRISPKMKRPVSEYKRKPFPPLYVSQSTIDLHEGMDEKKASKDSVMKSSVSLLQLNSNNDRRVSIDSGLASADTENDSLNFDLSFSTDVFAALANIHGISMTNNSTSTTV